MSRAVARGACLCGAVRFVATLPSNWVAHCHCTRCQRAHGAAFVTWVGMSAPQVEVIDTEDQLRWFRTEGAGERGFCATCGSSLFFRSPRWPGELHIARALFTDPVDRAPQLHAYHDSHVEWAKVDDDLPTRDDPGAG